MAPLTKVSSRFRGPYATLLKKEFRVQQISFLLAGVFVLIGVAGFCLAKRYADWPPESWGEIYSFTL